MVSRFDTQAINIYSGIDGSSNEASVRDGFLLEADNADFSESGVVQKRLGHHIVGGCLPVRVKSWLSDIVELDSQPVVVLSGTILPFGKDGFPNYVNDLIDDYSLGVTHFTSTFCLLSISDTLELDLLSSDILIEINGVTVKPSFKLSDNLFIIPTHVMGGVITEESAVTVKVYKGFVLPIQSGIHSYEYNESTTSLKVYFTEPIRVTVGSKVCFDSLYYTSYEPVKGTVTEVGESFVNILIGSSPIDRAVNGVTISYFILSMYFVNTENVSIKVSTETTLHTFVEFVNGPNTISVNTTSNRVGLFWIYGLQIYPPVIGIAKYSDNLIAIGQNWAFNFDRGFTTVSQPTPYKITSEYNLKIKRGYTRIPVYVTGVVTGDWVHFPNLDAELSLADVKWYEVKEVSPSLVVKSVIQEGLLKIPSNSKIIYQATRDTIIVSEYVVPGSSIDINGIKLTVLSVFSSGVNWELKLSKSVTYTSTDKVYVDNLWTPINFAGGVLFPYTGLNPSIFCTDVYKVTTSELSDRTYISTGEGGIWRYNGRNLTSLRFQGPGMPLLRRLIDVPGSLPAESSPEGSIASEVIITVNYVWEDFDGKLSESTYINQEDLVIRPSVTESGDAEQIEVCVPTFPDGLGIPADEVMIRVYSGEVGVDTELYMVSEVRNNPTVATIVIPIGDKFTKYKSTFEDVALPTAPGLLDSPMVAPKCEGISGYGSNLVAYNITTDPSIEIATDKIFTDDERYLVDLTDITYTPLIGEPITFRGETSLRSTLQVDSKPADGLFIEEFQYLDRSNYVHFDYGSSELVFGMRVPKSLIPAGTVNRALITVLNNKSLWSLDFNSIVYEGTGWSENGRSRNVLRSPIKQTEETFFADVNPKTTIIHYFELFDTANLPNDVTGTQSNTKPIIVVSGGKPYLAMTVSMVESMNRDVFPVPDDPTNDETGWLTRSVFRIHFWNEQDETLGNFVEVETGKVLNWNTDIVFTIGSTSGFTLTGTSLIMYPIEFVSTEPTLSDVGASLKIPKLSFNNYINTVDVLGLEGGNTHGSFSLFCGANASVNDGDDFITVGIVNLGDSRDAYDAGGAYPVERGRYEEWGLALPLGDTPYYHDMDIYKPGKNGLLLAVINLADESNTSLYSTYVDGDKVKVKLFDANDFPAKHIPAEGMLSLNQGFTIVDRDFFRDSNYPNYRFLLLRAPRSPSVPYIEGSTNRVLFNDNLKYAKGYVYKNDFIIEDDYFQLPIKYGDWSLWSGDFGSDRLVGDWCFVILAGVDVNEVYLEYSGWFQLAETLSTSVNAGYVRLKKNRTLAPRGFNTLYNSYIMFNTLDPYVPNMVPVPLPLKPYDTGAESDIAYPMFARSTDEGNTPLNSFVARFTHAINTVLPNKVYARYGAAPTGDLLSDIYPSNGIKITPKSLIDRYQELKLTGSLSNGTESVYTKEIINITVDKYENPTDSWSINISGDITEYIWCWGVDSLTNNTKVFRTSEQTSINLTYSDSILPATIYWTISVTDSDTRLPVFGFRNIERLGAEDNEPITGVTRWQDTVVFSKPSSLWAVQIDIATANKQRIQTPEGSKSGQLVATEDTIYYTGQTGVWKTNGTATEKIGNLTRYFRDRVIPLSYKVPWASSSYNNLSKSIYMGVPYTLSNTEYPSCRFKVYLESDAWSVDTNIPASNYAYIEHREFFSSFQGNVYQERLKSDVDAYSDSHDGIPFKLRSRYMDTETATKVKFYRNLYFLLGEKSETYVNVGISTDFKKAISGDYTKLNIKPENLGVNFGKSNFGGSCYLTDFRVSTPARFSHMSVQVDNSDVYPVEVFAIFLESLPVTSKTKKEK